MEDGESQGLLLKESVKVKVIARKGHFYTASNIICRDGITFRKDDHVSSTSITAIR